eukprot:scaffold568_cov160-Amphora_coffeaeformis.AAC.5
MPTAVNNNNVSTTAKKTMKTSYDDVSKGDGAPPPLAKRPRSATATTQIDRVDYDDVKLVGSNFFQNYIAKRKPCILQTNKAAAKMASWPSMGKLEDILGDCQVQVEQRPDDLQTFGQSRSSKFMTDMSFAEFIRQDPSKRHLYYLSTQEETSEDKQYSCLTERLVQQKHIPAHLPLAGNLQLQSCHVWMGASQGSCSGLHHDFHDNFYCVMAGRKRLYLYPPAAPIPVYGTRDTIHPNGLISYTAKPTRADGVPLAELLGEESKRVSERKIHKQGESDGEDGDDDDEEEEIVIGKGFDYRSESENEDDIDSTRDDFDNLEAEGEFGEHSGDFGQALDQDDEKDGHQKPAAIPNRPDHFSPVNLNSPTLYADFPVMRAVEPLVVELHKGEILYLPASCIAQLFDPSKSLDEGTTTLSGDVMLVANQRVVLASKRSKTSVPKSIQERLR